MRQQTTANFSGTSRFHVGLAVTNVERSKEFYEILFGLGPSKERPGYVKFEPASPSVNLTLNEVPQDQQGSKPATHYGIQVKSVDAVRELSSRLEQHGLKVEVEEESTCCYALQHKAWVVDPDENAWEIYVVLDADISSQSNGGCCGPLNVVGNSTCC